MDLLEQIQFETALVGLSATELVAYVRRAEWAVPRLDPATGANLGARREQLPPKGVGWDLWLALAGRGWGKTRCAVEWLWWEAWNDPGSYNHVVVRRSEDLAKVAFEGESGLLRCVPREVIAHVTKNPWKITLKNGAVILGFSAEEPDVLRGPQSHRCWCDELATWKRLDAAWNDGVLFGNRLKSIRNGGRPKIIVTTTPRPLRLIADLERESRKPGSGVIISTGSTMDNAANLSPYALEVLRKKFAGTRRGMQELEGKLLMDIPGALFTLEMIKRAWDFDWRQCRRVRVGVDPAISSEERSNETGIVVGGIGVDGRGYLLGDRSGVHSPDEWGRRAVELHDEFQADGIVIEANQGGDMCRTVLEAAAERLWREGARTSRQIEVRKVHASRGKAIRAEPVSQLYEQGKISHCGEFEELEAQMTTFTADFDRNRDGSPDRLDAMVWLFTDLLVEQEAPIESSLLHAAPRGVGFKGVGRPDANPFSRF